MIFRFLRAVCLALIFCAAARAQTLTLSNTIQTYSSLSSTTATLTGKSELRLTASSSVLTSCTINLNSEDSWLFFTNVIPSVVNSTYLSQIKVNTAAAVIGTNCRVVQYGDGTVVIPHSSSYTPMKVYTGPNFTGSTTSLANYTIYTDSNLGTTYANNISSFKLKRGYMATVAQNSTGTGVSRNYVAQDGDIEVSLLPTELDDSISFIRIFPWRWVNKKGIAGNIESGLNVRWKYDWNIDQNSSLDLEYVPIRQLRYWPSLSQNWQTIGANTVLGYNEPDSADQANIAVGDAVWSWPDLLGTGMRVGSPAPTDGGLSWLYSFVDQCDAADQRIDFIAVHYYRSYSNAADPDGAATQFYNFLKGIYDRTKRPIWITEWNNGANWTTDADPTYAQQAATVGKIMDMLESAPFVERYALYNWVEDVRRVKWDDGSLTTAGTVYRDKVSSLSYSQVIPEVPTSPGAWYKFENDARDSSAYGHMAMMKGAATFATGKNGQAVVMSGDATAKDHVQLSSRIGDSTDFTFGAWVYWNGGSNWQRIFDLGADTSNYMFLTPSSSSGTVRFAIKNGGSEQQLNSPSALPTNTWTHVAVTISGNTGKLFINGSLVATNTSMTINPVDLGTTTNYLGKSQFAADPYFAGKLDDVQFLPYALSDAKVTAMQTNNAPVFTNATIVGAAGTQNVAYSGTVAGQATDADSGDTITYSKAYGPSWLSVAANGTLSGTPSYDDEGLQEFIIYATDSAGATAYATLQITLPSVSGNGTWTSDADGSWNDLTKWSGSFPANGIGNTGYFSTINITSDRTVTLDSSRNIGSLQFNDTTGTQSWTIAAASGKTLTLAVASGTPSIVVTKNTATISAPLAGTAGLNKSGAGTLVLSGTSTLSGTLNIDSNGATAEGAVRLAHPDSGSSLTAIQIRNNQAGGSSTLELDGTRGAITSAATIALSARTNTVPAILNKTGTNTLSGALTINSGGSSYTFQSDAGSLTLSGGITSGATGSRALTFQGSGDFIISGAITNGSATTGISLTKTGTGTLTLSGANTNTGTTTVNGGTLTVTSTGALSTAALSLASGTTLNLNKATTFSTTVSGAGAINNTASTTITGDFSGFSGSYTHNSTTVSTGLNAATATSKNAAYTIASNQGSSQGMVVAGTGDYTLEMGSLNGVSNSLLRGGNTATGTATVKIGNLNTNDTFAGIISNGVTKVIAFQKVGTGTMILSGANTYTGATSVNAGNLQVNGSLGSTAVTVASGATLSGSGSLAGAVTVQSGGILSPGGTQGTLTINNSLTLQAGSATQIDLNKGSGITDKLVVNGALTRAGTLLITNSSGTLAAGDSFDVLDATTASGSFSTITLPTLAAGLQWNTSGLSSGILSVEYIASTYAGWASQYTFADGKNAPTDNPDGDALDNSLEWLLGTNPTLADVPVMPTSIQGGSALTGANASKHYLTLTTRIRKSYTGATVIPQANVDLNQLDSPASQGVVSSFQVSDLGEFETRTWYFNQAIEDTPGGKAFMRLKVTVP
jgi:autotransporter-associated beta strand protein